MGVRVVLGTSDIITTLCPVRIGIISIFYTRILETASGNQLQTLIKLNSMCQRQREQKCTSEHHAAPSIPGR